MTTPFTSVVRARLVALIVALAFPPAALAQAAPAANKPLPVPPTNPKAVVRQMIGPTEVEVSFSRPGMKGRTVFGSLVPWDRVWRTGADNATQVRFSTEVIIGGTKVPAGTYELFSIPGRAEWSLVLQRSNARWGSYTYADSNDVVRVRVAPTPLAQPVETLAFGFSDLTARSARMNIEWERTRVALPIEVDVVGIMVPEIAAAMRAEGRKPYFLAAMFYYENGLDLDQAAAWMDEAIREQPGHIGMLHRQALILAKKGDTTAAIAAAQKSFDGAQRSTPELKDEYTRLNSALLERLRRRPSQ